MRKNFGVKPYTYPQPVFIIGTYDENGVPDAMNAAWGGISEENRISICLDPTHKTVSNLVKTGAFTVSMATESQTIPCDYVGIVSANDVPDKFAKAGFHAIKSEKVNAPIIEELPMCLECKVLSWEESTCTLIGEIMNVNADESILTEGKIDAEKLRPIVYDPCGHNYYSLGKVVGKAFFCGKELN
ncbi:MAG: flavin reductase family protein [archaeon]|nr:flavin reductase family protein [archaeon]